MNSREESMFLYEINKTMEMLGHQYVFSLISKDGVAHEDFHNILDAYEKKGNHSLYEVGVDAFMLGYIYGKRAERARRRNPRKDLA